MPRFLAGDCRPEKHASRSAPEDADNFRENHVTFLGEERIALGIKQAGAIVTGDFGNVAMAAASAKK